MPECEDDLHIFEELLDEYGDTVGYICTICGAWGDDPVLYGPYEPESRPTPRAGDSGSAAGESRAESK